MYLGGQITFYRYVATFIGEVATFSGYTTFGGYVADLADR
jgi:hypothetical protein